MNYYIIAQLLLGNNSHNQLQNPSFSLLHLLSYIINLENLVFNQACKKLKTPMLWRVEVVKTRRFPKWGKISYRKKVV